MQSHLLVFHLGKQTPLNSQVLKKTNKYIDQLHNDCHFYISVHYLLIPTVYQD